MHALIPAAGTGQRFGGPMPKQYLTLCGKPIIQHTLERILEVVDHIYVAISEGDDYWADLEISRDSRITSVKGGGTRAESVQNALKAIPYARENDWVLVHDAVRPLVNPANIHKLVLELDGHPVGGLLASPVYETVKRANQDAEVIRTEDRHGLWLAQTPQIVRYAPLMEALNRFGHLPEVTDEASALEAAGHGIKLVEGARTNIKITKPGDLEFAEFILAKQT